MSEKTAPVELTASIPYGRQHRRSVLSRFLVGCIAAIFIYGTFKTFSTHKPCTRHRTGSSLIPVGTEDVNATAKVPLEVHIMSKCPDAKDCLKDLVVPAMEDIADKVDFKLSYIGTPTKDSGVECKHGPSECLGNILELCAADLYSDAKVYLGFTMCLTNDYQHIPETGFVKDCALEHGIDFDKLNECASRENGQYGWDLLRHSVNRSRDAGVTKSCTVRLDDKIRCIRDGGEWTDCDEGSRPQDLVRDVTNAAS